MAVSACVDEDAPVAPSGDPRASVVNIPADSLIEDPPMLAISRQLPSFGGFYFDDQDRIVVALTDVADLGKAEGLIRPWLGSHQPTGGFVARQVEYSFLELARHRTVLRRQRVFAIPGVVALGVDESENRVKVGIAGLAVATGLAARQEVGTRLSALGIPEEAVVFREMPQPVESSHTLRSSQPDGAIEGGWQIESSAHSCTLGFSAVRSDGSEVFVTNTHCTAVKAGYDGGWIRQPNSSGITLGYEVLDPAPHTCGYPGFEDDCRNADAALISASVPIHLGKIARTTSREGKEGVAGPLTIDHANPTLTITGRNDHVFQNEILDKIGRTTGWTYGAVEDTCDDVEVNGLVKQCSDRVDYHGDGGDSGSPVFYLKADGTAELRGIHWGDIIWPYSDSWMSDLSQIQQDLGSLIVVDAPVGISMTGPSEVPASTICEWDASLTSPGRPPYSVEWRRSGATVSTAWGYGGNVGTMDFDLEVIVTDGTGDTDTDGMIVDVVPNDEGMIQCEW